MVNFRSATRNVRYNWPYRRRNRKFPIFIETPYIYQCLASNISAMSIRYPNLQLWSFLLFGSYDCFFKGNLPGRLKFISVLYAIGLYNDYEWFLDREDEQYIRYSPTVCTCRCVDSDLSLVVYNGTPLPITVCMSFLPSELPYLSQMPWSMNCSDMLVFVQLRKKKQNVFCRWQYRVVVDCYVYFFFLKYLIKKKLKMVHDFDDAIDRIKDLLVRKKMSAIVK